jgi:hypothetical protein
MQPARIAARACQRAVAGDGITDGGRRKDDQNDPEDGHRPLLQSIWPETGGPAAHRAGKQGQAG